MKKKFYIKTALLSLVSMAMLSSCLKDNSHFVNFAASKPLIEFPVATGVGASGGEFQPAAFNISTTPQQLTVLVNLAAPKPLSTPVTVGISVDQSALAAYNASNIATYKADSASAVASGSTLPSYPTIYTLLPAADYSSTLSVTIPAGQNEAYLTVNINSNLIDLTQNYILPLTITNGGGQQISNYKTLLYNVQAKNAFDGVYSDNAFVLRAGDNTLTGNFSGVSVPLSTSGPNSVTFTQFWGDGASAVGGVNPITLTVDPTSNKVTVSSSVNATLVGDPAYNNHYDPANKKFYVSFYWNAGKASRDATDTLTYKGSR